MLVSSRRMTLDSNKLEPTSAAARDVLKVSLSVQYKNPTAMEPTSAGISASELERPRPNGQHLLSEFGEIDLHGAMAYAVSAPKRTPGISHIWQPIHFVPTKLRRCA